MRHSNNQVRRRASRGFTLVEMMTALLVFLIISGAAFGLLSVSQQRYQSESQVLNSFQEARLGMDQIVRDVNDSGFPPPNQFSASSPPPPHKVATTPFAWSPGYCLTPCQVGSNCVSPSNFDLIVETDIDPQNPSDMGVEWIRYQLVGTTLYRGVIQKQDSGDPLGYFTTDQMVPFVQNVMNNASPSQIAQFQTYYPSMFPGGNPVPVFTYMCDTANGPVPCGDPRSTNNGPTNIRGVEITLIVMTPLPDAQTGRPRLVELNGRGRRMNPNQ